MSKAMLKMQTAGFIYESSWYDSPYGRNDSPAIRQKRIKETTEAKKRINKMKAKSKLVMQIAHNFKAGIDLFVTLTLSKQLGRKIVAKYLERFCRRWRRDHPDFKYLAVIEEQNWDGEEVQRHIHMIITAPGGLKSRRGVLPDLNLAWNFAAGKHAGTVEVGALWADVDRLCAYLLKQNLSKGKRKWTHSRNLKMPPKPIKRRVSIRDNILRDVPPGCKWLDGNFGGNIFCFWGWMRCLIIDQRAFRRWWRRQEKKSKNADP